MSSQLSPNADSKAANASLANEYAETFCAVIEAEIRRVHSQGAKQNRALMVDPSYARRDASAHPVHNDRDR
jgi:hypothetical protein